MELRRQCLQRRRFHGLGFLPIGPFVEREAKAFKPPNKFAFDSYVTCVVYIGHHGLLLAKPAQQNRCAPINKSLGQRLMQRV